ncbi:MAG: hypothetical protein RI907_2207 [Pseudomonadota bacterium]|jgi:hypothetical protein
MSLAASTPHHRTDEPTADAADPLKGAPWPARHGLDRDAARAMTRRLRWMAREVGEPDEATWASMGRALMRGDPLADDVADWMLQRGGARMWPQVDTWLRGGPAGAAAAGAAPAVQALLAATWQLPHWADLGRADAGARALHTSGLHGMMVLRDAGLMAGYQASAINETLLRTGALHEGAQRRVALTTTWWMAVTEPGGMVPGSPGHLHTLQVRIMHALVRQRLRRDPTWDTAYFGLPVNQLDMQVTYLAFSVIQLLSLTTTGMWMPKAQREDVMHLWRVVGWAMGVDSDLLCRDEAEGRRALVHNLLSQAPADEGSRQLARALLDEPLHRHYHDLAKLRGRLNRQRHLSLVAWFVGADGLRQLGLPRALPWYPMLTMAPHGLRAVAMAAWPGLRRRLQHTGRQAQRAYLDVLTGGVGHRH